MGKDTQRRAHYIDAPTHGLPAVPAHGFLPIFVDGTGVQLARRENGRWATAVATDTSDPDRVAVVYDGVIFTPSTPLASRVSLYVGDTDGDVTTTQSTPYQVIGEVQDAHHTLIRIHQPQGAGEGGIPITRAEGMWESGNDTGVAGFTFAPVAGRNKDLAGKISLSADNKIFTFSGGKFDVELIGIHPTADGGTRSDLTLDGVKLEPSLYTYGSLTNGQGGGSVRELFLDATGSDRTLRINRTGSNGNGNTYWTLKVREHLDVEYGAGSAVTVAGKVPVQVGDRFDVGLSGTRDIVTGIDYRTADFMRVSLSNSVRTYREQHDVPIDTFGVVNGGEFNDGLLHWFNSVDHFKIGFVNDATGTVRVQRSGAALFLEWIEFYGVANTTPEPMVVTKTDGETATYAWNVYPNGATVVPPAFDATKTWGTIIDDGAGGEVQTFYYPRAGAWKAVGA